VHCHLHLDNRQEIRAPYSRRSADTSTAPRPTRLTRVPWRGVALVHRILLVVLIRWVVNLTLWRIPGSRVDARGCLSAGA
jgi:hypothetical protein